MTVGRLINMFSTFTKPVEVGDVRDQIVHWGYHDLITIRPFDKDPRDLLGNILYYKTTFAYGAEMSYCVINYNKNVSVPMQRLVCVKELIHSMDDISVRVSSKRQLNDLLDEILHDHASVGSLRKPALFEDLAIYQALSILSSEEVREDLYEKFNSGQINLNDVATQFAIPVEYAGYLMVPNWKQFRDQLAQL